MATTSTNIPNGVNNAPLGSAMDISAVPDPTVSHLFFDDFDRFAAADWTITNVGVTPTNALTAENGGALLTTTTTGATDSSFLQRTAAAFAFTAGKQSFFKARFKPSDATTSDFYAGVIATSTTPLAAADGVFFFKATGQTGWVLRTINGGTTVDLPLPAACVAANATYCEVAFAYDGKDLYAFFNSVIGTQTFNPATMNRDYVAVLRAPSLTSALLNISFGLRNGAAAAKTLTTDYILASFER